MRLTCPRCGAQYEIPETVIPASGREVECSACAEVWHQPAMPPVAAPAIAATTAAEAPASYDPAARPALNRPLHESVLSILREETARELSARAAQAGPDAPRATPHLTHQSAPPLPGAALPTGADIEWPVSTVILPGEPIAPESNQEAAPTPLGDALVPPEPEPEPEPQPEPVAAIPTAPALPDAARLAATLTRAVPVSRPATEVVALPVAQAELPPSPAAPPSPARPVAPAPAKRGYAAGLALAVVLAAALLASYRLAPPMTPETADEALAGWRQQLDQGRLWLHEQALALRGIFNGS